MFTLLGKAFVDSQPIFTALFVGTVSVGVSDTQHQAALPSSAPPCVMETVKAEGGNYYYTRQKPGACKL